VSETTEMFNEIKKIRFRMDALDSGQEMIVRANKSTLLEELMPEFKKSGQKSKVLLAVNNERTLKQIADAVNMKAPNVTPQITWLRENGLVEINKALSGSSSIYRKTRAERILGITKQLKKMGYTEPTVAVPETESKEVEQNNGNEDKPESVSG